MKSFKWNLTSLKIILIRDRIGERETDVKVEKEVGVMQP